MEIITYSIPHENPAMVFNKRGELIGEVSGLELKLKSNWEPTFNERKEVVGFIVK